MTDSAIYSYRDHHKKKKSYKYGITAVNAQGIESSQVKVVIKPKK